MARHQLRESGLVAAPKRGQQACIVGVA